MEKRYLNNNFTYIILNLMAITSKFKRTKALRRPERKLRLVQPKLGEGIYLIKDVAKILKIDYEKTYRWIVGYWGLGGLDENTKYTFGEVGNRAINFYSLIEFYTFFKLREQGASSSQIKKLHSALSLLHKTKYPFAVSHYFLIDNKRKLKPIYYEFSQNLVKLDKKHQFSFKFIEDFLQKIEFGDDNLATRFFPLHNSKSVVVDPNHQFGQPVINGTNIKTQTIFSLYHGGEKIEDISKLYNISVKQVEDAVNFQNAA